MVTLPFVAILSRFGELRLICTPNAFFGSYTERIVWHKTPLIRLSMYKSGRLMIFCNIMAENAQMPCPLEDAT
jgi:hypothetical protein